MPKNTKIQGEILGHLLSLINTFVTYRKFICIVSQKFYEEAKSGKDMGRWSLEVDVQHYRQIEISELVNSLQIMKENGLIRKARDEWEKVDNNPLIAEEIFVADEFQPDNKTEIKENIEWYVAMLKELGLEHDLLPQNLEEYLRET